MATKKNRLAAGVTAAVAVLAGVCASFANAAPRAGTTSFVSPPPKLERQFNWYHSNPAGRKLQARETQRVDLSTFGSKAIVGLETNGDLQALIEDYGFSFLQVEAVPQLHAAEVTGDPAQLETLLSAAPNDARIRYVSPVGPKRHLLHRRNDPLHVSHRSRDERCRTSGRSPRRTSTRRSTCRTAAPTSCSARSTAASRTSPTSRGRSSTASTTRPPNTTASTWSDTAPQQRRSWSRPATTASGSSVSAGTPA